MQPRDLSLDHKPCPDARPLARLQLDHNAIGLLAVMRHLLTSFTEPETQAWQMAFATAQERWGETEGPQLAMAILALVQAVRRVRPQPFRFANPLCLCCRDWVTPEEADLLAMVQAMRRDRTDAAREHLAKVTSGRMDPMVIQSGLGLARRLGQTAIARPMLLHQAGLARLH